MLRVGAAVMAHPVREKYALEVSRKLRHAPIAWDKAGPPTADPVRRWEVAKQAWNLAAEQGCEYSLVVQDDALVCQNLLEGLSLAVQYLPNDLEGQPIGAVSPYTGTGRPDQYNVRKALTGAESGGYSWLSTRSLNWGVAIMLPTWCVPRMLGWCSRPVSTQRNTDYRIGLWIRDKARWRTWYTCPSLVEHRDLPSLVGHDVGPPRRAHNFIGEAGNALDVNWAAVPDGGLNAYWLYKPSRVR